MPTACEFHGIPKFKSEAPELRCFGTGSFVTEFAAMTIFEKKSLRKLGVASQKI
jgi:hypothetical protein